MTERVSEEQRYAAAYHLLTDLRIRARRLTVGGAAAAAVDLLLELAGRVRYDRAAVLVPGAGASVRALAALDGDRQPTGLDWLLQVSGETDLAESWLSQRPLLLQHGLTRADGSTPPGSALVAPVRFGARTLGLLAAETSAADAYRRADADAAATLGARSGVTLGTVLALEETQDAAVQEERRRMAREIHDGIAQDVAALGYVLDGLAVGVQPVSPDLAAEVRGVRAELRSALVGVRRSIADLRTVTDSGLGTALRDLGGTVAARTDLEVHLDVRDSGARLSAAAADQLLRIAQESTTNVRKHARAANLWLVALLRPDSVVLRIEDDGVGLGTAAPDRYGLEIMRERALRLGASLTVQGRQPSGTLVEVSLTGEPLRKATAGPD